MPHWLRRLLWSILLVLGGVLLATLALLWALVQPLPQVERDDLPLSHAAAGRLKAQLQQAAVPQAASAPTRRLRLTRADLDTLLHDGARRALQGAARLELGEGQARLQASLPLRQGPLARQPLLRPLAALGPWLNLDLTLAATPAGPPALQSLRIGRLPVHPALARHALQALLAHQLPGLPAGLALDAIEQVQIGPQAVQLSWHWQPEWRDRLRSALLPPADQARLQASHADLVALVAPAPGRPAGQALPLAPLLQTLFQRATERAMASAALGGVADEAAEQRALLITLALYATGQSPARLVAGAREWPAAHSRVLTLREREDFAQHFLVSAVLAAEGGGRLADMIGLYKEMADTRGAGSGFSFNDIAADRAGTRLGQRVRRDAGALAAALQAQPLRDADLMPAVDDLPQFLTEAEFRQRYGTIGSPAYQAQLEQIEQRLDTLPLLR